jgi:hypothetical protein
MVTRPPVGARTSQAQTPPIPDSEKIKPETKTSFKAFFYSYNEREEQLEKLV